MKKTISILIAFILCFSFSSIALAATDTTAAETTAAETTAAATTAEATTAAATTTQTTTLPEATTLSETLSVGETTEPDAVLLDETVADGETVLDDSMTLYKEYTPPENGNEEIMYASAVPQTGSAAGGIAVFATLSIAAAAVFVCRKRTV